MSSAIPLAPHIQCHMIHVDIGEDAYDLERRYGLQRTMFDPISVWYSYSVPSMMNWTL